MRKLFSEQTTDEATNKPERRENYSTPRWVKIFGIVTITLILFVVILHLTGNSSGGPGSHTPPSSELKQGDQQP